MGIDKGLDHRGIYRAIYTSLWDDPEFRKFTINEKLVFLNLRTNPLSNIPVLYTYYLEAIEQQTGIRRKQILKALRTLVDANWIALQDGVVWVRKGLKFDPNIVLTNEKHLTAVKNIILSLPKLQIVRDFIDFYKISIPYPIPSRIPYGIPYAIQDTDPEEEKEKEEKENFFELFWKEYPNKTGKKSAQKEWERAKDKPPTEDLIQIIQKQIEHKAYLRKNNLFCPEWPNPQNWIKDSRWSDELIWATVDHEKPREESKPVQIKCDWCDTVYFVSESHECKGIKEADYT